MKVLASILLLASILVTIPYAAGSPTGIIIRAFAVSGVNAANSAKVGTDECIELFNLNNTAVDITGWQLQYKAGSATTYASNPAFTFPSYVMQPGDSVLIGHADYQPATAGGVNADLSYNSLWSMNSPSGNIRLSLPGTSQNKGNLPGIIDRVGYGTAANDAENLDPIIFSSGAGGNLQPTSTFRRKTMCGTKADTDDNAVDFELYTPSNGVREIRNSLSEWTNCWGPNFTRPTSSTAAPSSGATTTLAPAAATTTTAAPANTQSPTKAPPGVVQTTKAPTEPPATTTTTSTTTTTLAPTTTTLAPTTTTLAPTTTTLAPTTTTSTTTTTTPAPTTTTSTTTTTTPAPTTTTSTTTTTTPAPTTTSTTTTTTTPAPTTTTSTTTTTPDPTTTTSTTTTTPDPTTTTSTTTTTTSTTTTTPDPTTTTTTTTTPDPTTTTTTTTTPDPTTTTTTTTTPDPTTTTTTTTPNPTTTTTQNPDDSHGGKGTTTTTTVAPTAPPPSGCPVEVILYQTQSWESWGKTYTQFNAIVKNTGSKHLLTAQVLFNNFQQINSYFNLQPLDTTGQQWNVRLWSGLAAGAEYNDEHGIVVLGSVMPNVYVVGCTVYPMLNVAPAAPKAPTACSASIEVVRGTFVVNQETSVVTQYYTFKLKNTGTKKIVALSVNLNGQDTHMDTYYNLAPSSGNKFTVSLFGGLAVGYTSTNQYGGSAIGNNYIQAAVASVACA